MLALPHATASRQSAVSDARAPRAASTAAANGPSDAALHMRNVRAANDSRVCRSIPRTSLTHNRDGLSRGIAHVALRRLDRRARGRAVGAEHAAVAWLRPELGAAPGTVMDDHARVGGHGQPVRAAAVRTEQQRSEGGSHLGKSYTAWQAGHPFARTPSTPSRAMIGTIASAAAGSAHHQPSPALSATPTSAITER